MTGRGGRGGKGERPFCIELSDIRPRGGREGVAEHEADEQHADTSRADQQRVAGRPLKGLPLRRCNGSRQMSSTPLLPEHSVGQGSLHTDSLRVVCAHTLAKCWVLSFGASRKYMQRMTI